MSSMMHYKMKAHFLTSSLKDNTLRYLKYINQEMYGTLTMMKFNISTWFSMYLAGKRFHESLLWRPLWSVENELRAPCHDFSCSCLIRYTWTVISEPQNTHLLSELSFYVPCSHTVPLESLRVPLQRTVQMSKPHGYTALSLTIFSNSCLEHYSTLLNYPLTSAQTHIPPFYSHTRHAALCDL